MATRDQIIDFLQQSSYVLRNIAQANEKLNEARSAKALLEAQGESEHALKFAAHIATMQGQHTELVGVFTTKTKRGTIEAGETLLKDINELMKLADEAHDGWRTLVAKLEVGVRTGDVSGDDRAQLEAQIGSAQKRYEASIAAASDLVPTPGIVLL